MRRPLPWGSCPLYAAYGSNMDPTQMLERCSVLSVRGTGWLPGWRLTFGGEDLCWDGALATVVEDPESSVFVVLYDMADSDERTLILGGRRPRAVHQDPAAGAHHGRLTCWPGCTRCRRTRVDCPPPRYLGVFADAAEAADAPAEYVNDLRTRPCKRIGP